jgi:hypothetical protein
VPQDVKAEPAQASPLRSRLDASATGIAGVQGMTSNAAEHK